MWSAIIFINIIHSSRHYCFCIRIIDGNGRINILQCFRLCAFSSIDLSYIRSIFIFTSTIFDIGKILGAFFRRSISIRIKSLLISSLIIFFIHCFFCFSGYNSFLTFVFFFTFSGSFFCFHSASSAHTLFNIFRSPKQDTLADCSF